jgi:hypothetical protein
MTDLDDAPERSNDEIRRLLRQVLSEPQSAPTAPAAASTRSQSISEGKTPELSLEEILQKIQRDIAEGRPIPLGPSTA